MDDQHGDDQREVDECGNQGDRPWGEGQWIGPEGPVRCHVNGPGQKQAGGQRKRKIAASINKRDGAVESTEIHDGPTDDEVIGDQPTIRPAEAGRGGRAEKKRDTADADNPCYPYRI